MTPAPQDPSPETPIDAGWVLRQAVVLHEAVMAAGAWAVAKSVLDLIGKHVDVQAFRDQPPGPGEAEALDEAEIEARIRVHEARRAHEARRGDGDAP